MKFLFSKKNNTKKIINALSKLENVKEFYSADEYRFNIYNEIAHSTSQDLSCTIYCHTQLHLEKSSGVFTCRSKVSATVQEASGSLCKSKFVYTGNLKGSKKVSLTYVFPIMGSASFPEFQLTEQALETIKTGIDSDEPEVDIFRRYTPSTPICVNDLNRISKLFSIIQLQKFETIIGKSFSPMYSNYDLFYGKAYN